MMIGKLFSKWLMENMIELDIDSYSDEHDEYTKKYYLRNEHNDALMIICYSDYISSQY